MDIAQTEQKTDDSGLLAELRQGQARAFEQLMRRYNRRLFRAARGIVRDDAEAQDAVQEGYLHAFQSLHSFRGDSSIGTWLTRIVINQALTQQRRYGRIVLWSEDADEEGEMPHQQDQPAHSAEEEFARRELREETGYEAASLERLGVMTPNPALFSNRCFTYLATGCRRAGELQMDPGEDIEVVTIPVRELDAAILRGEIDHALVLAAFAFWRAKG